MRHSVLDRLHEDHAHMATIIELIVRELDAVDCGKQMDLELIEDTLAYVTAYPDACHHPAEDIVFARLGAVLPQASLEIEALRSEHVRLIASARAMLGAVRAVEEDALVTRAELLEAGRAYVDTLERHIDKEEAGLFRLAAEHLDAADWAAIAAAIDAMDDPLFGPAVARDHRRLWQRITAHAMRSVRPADRGS